jgi:hypothetical protein
MLDKVMIGIWCMRLPTFVLPLLLVGLGEKHALVLQGASRCTRESRSRRMILARNSLMSIIPKAYLNIAIQVSSFSLLFKLNFDRCGREDMSLGKLS